MPVRPRTAPALNVKPQPCEQAISLLRPAAFPNLERQKGFGLKGGKRGSDGGHFPVHTPATSTVVVPDVSGASLAVDAFLHKSMEPPTPHSDGYDADGAQRGHGVFHAHAHDMEFLAQWMGEMLDLNKKCGIDGKRDDGPSRKPKPTKATSATAAEGGAGGGSLAQLYSEKALRYCVIFDELVRQVAVHSEGLAALVGKAFAGHHTLLTRLLTAHNDREAELLRLQAEVRTLTGETNRRTNEEKALMEEEQFAENLTKVELRESRALCSSLRMKLNYYGEEVARLRQSVLDTIDVGEKPRLSRVHNSLTLDGLSAPVHPKGKKTITALTGRKAVGNELNQECSEAPQSGDVVTILALSKEKLDMHVKHETNLKAMLSQLSTESSKQSNDIDFLSNLIESTKFESFLKGILKEGKTPVKRTRETQTRPMRGGHPTDGGRPTTSPGGRKKPPKKTKGSKSELVPLDLRNSIGMASSPKKIPTLGYMLRTVLDMMLVWSRSLDTAESLCEKPGGMTEIAIKHFQLLHGMESTTSAMLAQFAAGLVHFADYKRCKVLGDLLGVDDVTKPPPHDHRAALFLYRFLAELRTAGIFTEDILRERIVTILLNKLVVARAAKVILGPFLPQGSPPVTALIPCLQDANSANAKRIRPGERGKGTPPPSAETPLARQTVELDELLPQAMAAWGKVMKHRASHIHLAFDRYCSTFQVTEELRFGRDEAPKPRDAVVMQLGKSFVENRERRQLYQSALDGSSQAEGQSEDGATGTTMRLENEIEQARKQQLEVSALTGAAPQRAMSWVLESTGDATCMNDYVSMNAPVVELLTKDDLALALRFLNPTLSDAETKALYKRGYRIQWDNTHTLFRGLWTQEETELGKKYWVHTVQDLTQWVAPYNINDFKREEIDREAFVELCFSGRVLDDSPLAQHFLGHPQALWEKWDAIVASLRKKGVRSVELEGDSKRPAAAQDSNQEGQSVAGGQQEEPFPAAAPAVAVAGGRRPRSGK